MGQTDRRRTRRVLLLAMLLALALGLTLLAWLAGREPGLAGVRVAPSAAPRRETGEPAIGIERVGLPAPSPATSVRLHVWVRDPKVAKHVINVPPEPFDRLWPQPGDAGWDPERFDELETVAELRLLTKPTRRIIEAHPVVAAAKSEGFLGPGADRTTPEAALVSLYAGWVEMEVVWYDARKAFDARHLPPDVAWGDLTSSERSGFMALDDWPYRDMSTMQSHAEEILGQWPDHPVADHALLVLVRAELNSDELAATDADEMAAILRAIRSDTVREEAVMIPVGMGSSFLPASPALLDAVGTVTPSDPAAALRIGAWAMNRAVGLGDWGRAEAWSSRVRDVLDEHCGAGGALREYNCTQQGYELRDIVGRLVGLGWTAPATWQEALTGEGWRCHLEVGHTGTSRATATFDGAGWTFGPWDAPTAATACLSQVRHLAVSPEGPVEVQLTYEGPWTTP